MSETPDMPAAATNNCDEVTVAWPPAPQGCHRQPLGKLGAGYLAPSRLARKTNGWMLLWIASVGLRLVFDIVKSAHPGNLAAEIGAEGSTFVDEVASTGAIILYLRWVYRIVANLAALGASGISASPGWAVGWYFVPIFGFFRPYQIMREVWRASTPELNLEDDPSGWRREPSGAIVRWWWGSLLFCYLLMPIFVFWLIFFSGITLPDTGLEIGVDILIVLQNIVAMRLVSCVTARQEKRASWLAAM